MYDERIAAIEVEELVLSTPFDALDSLSLCGASFGGWKLFAERWVDRSHRCDRFSECRATDGAGSAFDFG
jgi:hypothetical protein